MGFQPRRGVLRVVGMPAAGRLFTSLSIDRHAILLTALYMKFTPYKYLNGSAFIRPAYKLLDRPYNH